MIVALLRGEGLLVLDRVGNRLVNPRRLLAHGFGRIRAITESPEGYLYLSTSQYDPAEGQPKPDYDLILRIVPKALRFNYPAIDPARPSPDRIAQTPLAKAIAEHCAACHGAGLRGGSGPDLIDGRPRPARSPAELKALMVRGISERGMPPNPTITAAEQTLIVDYILGEH